MLAWHRDYKRLDAHVSIMCSPGRFFTAVELKIALAYLSLKYDMKFEDGRSRPPNVFLATAVHAAPNTTVLFRARPRLLKTLGVFNFHSSFYVVCWLIITMVFHVCLHLSGI